MNRQYETIAAALDAGLIRTHCSMTHERYRGFRIYSRDTSAGRNTINDQFSLAITYAEWPLDEQGEVAQELLAFVLGKTYGDTEACWCRLERSRLGNPGAYAALYPAQVYASAMVQMHRAIDGFYASHPASAAVEAARCAAVDAAEKRRADRRLERTRKLTSRGG